MTPDIDPEVSAKLGPELLAQVLQHYNAYLWGDNVVKVLKTRTMRLDADGNVFLDHEMELKASSWITDEVRWLCNIKDGKPSFIRAIHDRHGYFVGKPGMTFDQFFDQAKELNIVLKLPTPITQHRFNGGPWDGQTQPLPGERVPLLIPVPGAKEKGIYKLRIADSTEDLPTYRWQPAELPANLPKKEDLDL